MLEVFVKVFKMIMDVIYTARGINKLFNVALRGKCLPTPGEVSMSVTIWVVGEVQTNRQS